DVATFMGWVRTPRSRCAKAATHSFAAECAFGPRKPMVRSFPACCARAASGHAAAAPLNAASNSRRPMVTVIRPSRARCVNGTIPRRERAVPNSAAPGAGEVYARHRLQRSAAWPEDSGLISRDLSSAAPLHFLLHLRDDVDAPGFSEGDPVRPLRDPRAT